ncbi:glycerophosphodiester phosphodiesterase family protein [Vibrio sp. B1Z05]|uniref:glycerophosphodiester phosphodiesterase family protein n=1 Tax=Vibrio sp. B1Z05 TaxID=2654980 RepID=UPI00128C9BEE|nr:glycerophosphodiester phosphodiesterase family protein [Vibrio sp. B1Z05]MPW38004.1 glycerophosphodiester phosphodiesterase [Vibrio sp. B1Z05]
MIRFKTGFVFLSISLIAACDSESLDIEAPTEANIQLGPRPAYLVDQLAEGELKDSLTSCLNNQSHFEKSELSIGHRGAPLMFPEHTKESYVAAARMGAGVLECDVAFTSDAELVCRHSHSDLHTTTNVLATELADKCSIPFTPADELNGVQAQAECRTSDFTLAEFKSLQGKMDAYNPNAATVAEYMDATPSYRTDLYAGTGTLMTHKESIALFKELGVKMTPELKTPDAQDLAAAGLTQEEFAQKMIQEYIDAGVAPSDVYPQSFLIDDVEYWVANTPEFGEQGVYLTFSLNNVPTPAEIVEKGINIIAPIYPLLVTKSGDEVVATDYANEIKESGLDIITWTIERQYTDYNELEVVNVLKNDINAIGIFSDWPATVTFVDNCTE